MVCKQKDLFDLVPAHMGSFSWWSPDGVTLGGVLSDIDPGASSDRVHVSKLCYSPVVVRGSWKEQSVSVVVDYEFENVGASYKMWLYYGCQSLKTIHPAQAVVDRNEENRCRVCFSLDPSNLTEDRMLRVTLELVRESSHPVIIYGAWIEVS